MAYAFLDHPRPLAFAHRGGAAGGLENTMSAFAAAVRLGYRYLETDVHATRDGVLVAFHDATLDRVTAVAGHVEQLTWAELAGIRFGPDAERVPLLEDLLDAWPGVRLNVDVKADSAVEPLIAALRRTGAVDRVCVASFSDRRVALVREAIGPRLCTALGPRGVLRLRLGSYGLRTRPPEAPCAQVPARLGPVPVADARFVAHAHARGLQVHLWTVDEPAEINRLLDLGVDGIMADDIVALRDVLVARGCWVG